MKMRKYLTSVVAHRAAQHQSIYRCAAPLSLCKALLEYIKRSYDVQKRSWGLAKGCEKQKIS